MIEVVDFDDASDDVDYGVDVDVDDLYVMTSERPLQMVLWMRFARKVNDECVRARAVVCDAHVWASHDRRGEANTRMLLMTWTTARGMAMAMRDDVPWRTRDGVQRQLTRMMKWTRQRQRMTVHRLLLLLQSIVVSSCQATVMTAAETMRWLTGVVWQP
jgi:hypothetical protein